MAYIKIDETNRITSASYNYHCGDGEIETTIPDEISLDNIHDYKYIDGEYVYDPLPEPKPEPSQLDVLEAQVIYTAMMTETLLEV